MTTREAMKIMRSDTAGEDEYRKAKEVLVEARICPTCAATGYRAKLGEWQPGDQENYAGRECYDCEEFFPCGTQPEYATCPDEHSDADPGL